MFEKYVDAFANGPTPDLLKEIIEEHTNQKATSMKKNYDRYKANSAGVPVLTRELPGDAESKVNNKLANDWFSEIVDTKTGYMFGAPVIIQLDKGSQNYQKVLDHIETFRKRNSLDDTNAEIGKFAAMCGYDALLAYIDREGQERVKRIDPWETIIISNSDITNPEFGIRYYTTWEDKTRVEFYDSTKIVIFEGKSTSELAFVEEKPHLFEYCPLLGVPNNAELQGDADKVLTLIDSYDKTMSDVNSEIESFRLAYMLFIGYAPDDEEIKRMMQTGALYIPDSENGEDIKFLVKDIGAAMNAIDSHLDRLEANITRFAKHVNFTDEAFGGNLSGVAMRYKLFALETKAKYFERKHEAAMMHLFKVLASAWSKKGINLDYTQLDFKYTRNIPVNVLDEAQAAVQLKAVTSHRTALETLSFINDVEAEMDRIAEDRENMIDLDNIDDDEDKKAV